MFERARGSGERGVAAVLRGGACHLAKIKRQEAEKKNALGIIREGKGGTKSRSQTTRYLVRASEARKSFAKLGGGKGRKKDGFKKGQPKGRRLVSALTPRLGGRAWFIGTLRLQRDLKDRQRSCWRNT